MPVCAPAAQPRCSQVCRAAVRAVAAVARQDPLPALPRPLPAVAGVDGARRADLARTVRPQPAGTTGNTHHITASFASLLTQLTVADVPAGAGPVWTALPAAQRGAGRLPERGHLLLGPGLVLQLPRRLPV